MSPASLRVNLGGFDVAPRRTPRFPPGLTRRLATSSRSARVARTGRDATSARIHKEFAMPATFEDRFTMPGDVPFTMPGDSVFVTEDPDELLGRLWVAGTLDETVLPPDRKAALAAWKQKLLARTARETGARVVEAGSAETP